MKTTTILNAMNTARNYLESVAESRGTSFGIAVDNDPPAKTWQRLARQYRRFLARITERIEKDGSV